MNTLADLCAPLSKKTLKLSVGGNPQVLEIASVAGWEMSLIAAANPRPDPDTFAASGGERSPEYQSLLEVWYYQRLLAIVGAATNFVAGNASWSTIRGTAAAPGLPADVRNWIGALRTALGTMGIKSLQAIAREVEKLSDVSVELLEEAEKNS